MEKNRNKRKYVISALVFAVILILSITTVATTASTTAKVVLDQISQKEVKLSLKPEENKGVKSVQIEMNFNEEQEGFWNQNKIEDVTINWNQNWNIGNQTIGKIPVELAESSYDKDHKKLHIYVVSKTELTENGIIEIGTLAIKTKNDNAMKITMVPDKEKTVLIEPENLSNAVSVLVDEKEDSLELKVGSTTDPGDQNTTNNGAGNTNTSNNTSNNTNNSNNNMGNTNTNTNTGSNTTNNNTSGGNSNGTTNNTTNQNTNHGGNQSTQNNTNKEEQKENQAKGLLPKTGLNSISIVAIVVGILAAIGLGYSIYKLRHKK